jgi:hypothetical protein
MITLLCLGAFVAAGCARNAAPRRDGALAPAAAVGSRDVGLYVATLTSQNAHLAGRRVTGTATFVARGDQLDVTMDARGLVDGRHIAMVHGFADQRPAVCPTDEADRNGDSAIDVDEASASAGVPLIPLNYGMSMLEFESDKYPEARSGRLLFEHATSQSDIVASLSVELGLRRLAIEDYAVLVYGVSRETKLPGTLAALPNAAAWQSVPVACGVITRVR